MKESYGTTQVREVRFNRDDIKRLLIENVQARLDRSYDFDFDNPLVIKDGDDYIIRVVQLTITRDVEPRDFKLGPMPKKKEPEKKDSEPKTKE